MILVKDRIYGKYYDYPKKSFLKQTLKTSIRIRNIEIIEGPAWRQR